MSELLFLSSAWWNNPITGAHSPLIALVNLRVKPTQLSHKQSGTLLLVFRRGAPHFNLTSYVLKEAQPHPTLLHTCRMPAFAHKQLAFWRNSAAGHFLEWDVRAAAWGQVSLLQSSESERPFCDRKRDSHFVMLNCMVPNGPNLLSETKEHTTCCNGRVTFTEADMTTWFSQQESETQRHARPCMRQIRVSLARIRSCVGQTASVVVLERWLAGWSLGETGLLQ